MKGWNLKGRYNLLRQATLHMVGLPTDKLDELKQMAEHLRIPALTDADAVVSLLVLQTLIVTHDANMQPEVPDAMVQRLRYFSDPVFGAIISEDQAKTVMQHVLWGTTK